jgi:23S rRNA (adenine2503-C2)-methyltransferase
MELSELQQVLPEGQPAYRAAQLYRAIYHQKVSDLVQISTLPARVRDELAAGAELGLPGLSSRFESVDGTRRYLLSLSDGRTVETVLMPEGDRDTVCISSQVGCPVDCKFCMTALMGLERSLTAGEIVGQVLFVAKDNGLLENDKRFNIVMMGMGEPLLNLPNVLKATRILTDPQGVDFGD